MKKTTMAAMAVLVMMMVSVPAEAGILSRKGDCGYKVTSFRVEGQPGQSFEYAGKSFRIPARGALEIVAKKDALQIETGAGVIDLSESKPDDFGIVEVNLVQSQARLDQRSGR